MASSVTRVSFGHEGVTDMSPNLALPPADSCDTYVALPPADSCDTFVALPPATADGRVIFGKNSDRPPTEVQEVVFVPAQDHPAGSKVQCTYIEVDQAPHTLAVVLSKPAWMWGAEMGANELGVCIGNEAVFTKLNNSRSDLEERLLGMDIVRLALERATSASEAVDLIGQLLVSPGQGGPCSEEPGKQKLTYHNSFLIADHSTAWVLESAGHLWAAEHITEGVRNISNQLSIGTKIDRSCPGLIEEAKRLTLYTDQMGPFNFAQVFAVRGSPSAPIRYAGGLKMLKEFSSSGQFGVRDMTTILRDEQCGICRTGPDSVSTGSQVSVLIPPPPSSSSSTPRACHWFTATPNPNTSLFKPFVFMPKAKIGSATISPQYPDKDPAKKTPRFESQVDRRHPLYKQHEGFRKIVEQKAPKGLKLLKTLREREEKTIQNVEMQLKQGQFDESIATIFLHLSDWELCFYQFQ